MVTETWRNVVAWEGVYSISSAGRLRRDLQPRHCRDVAGRILLGRPDHWGYPRFILKERGRKRRRVCFIHGLVAEAFLGPKPPGFQVNHKNGVKTDNRLENLEYVTVKANCLHKTRVLGKQIGNTHCCMRTPDEQVREMRALLAQGVRPAQIGRRYGLPTTRVTALLYRRLLAPAA